MSTSLAGVFAGQWMAAAAAMAAPLPQAQLHSSILQLSDGFAIIDVSPTTVQVAPTLSQVMIGAAVSLDALLASMDATLQKGVRP